MRVDVDTWDPTYGPGIPAQGWSVDQTTGAPGTGGQIGETGITGAGPQIASHAEITCGVEMPESVWQPITPPDTVTTPSVVLMVDGVRRVDAQIWITGDDGVTQGGVAASFAAGVVRCDLRQRVAEIAETRVRRGVFTPSADALELSAGTVRYPVRPVPNDDPADLIGGVQRDLAALEHAVSAAVRSGSADRSGTDSPDDLMVVDGPLHGRNHLPRTLGYVKSHRSEYLPRHLTRVVVALRPGQRCPVFALAGTNWHRYTWYLRLPGPTGSPWAGMVRVECSGDLTAAEAIRFADQSAAILPRFASCAYKDPRAPQNLIPIAGLERRLRGLLGDARLLHRALTTACRGATGPSGMVPR